MHKLIFHIDPIDHPEFKHGVAVLLQLWGKFQHSHRLPDNEFRQHSSCCSCALQLLREGRGVGWSVINISYYRVGASSNKYTACPIRDTDACSCYHLKFRLLKPLLNSFQVELSWSCHRCPLLGWNYHRIPQFCKKRAQDYDKPHGGAVIKGAEVYQRYAGYSFICWIYITTPLSMDRETHERSSCNLGPILRRNMALNRTASYELLTFWENVRPNSTVYVLKYSSSRIWSHRLTSSVIRFAQNSSFSSFVSFSS